MDQRLDGISGEMDDMRNTLKELLMEIRTLKPLHTSHESSEVGNTGLEESQPPLLAQPPTKVAVVDPKWRQPVQKPNQEEAITAAEVRDSTPFSFNLHRLVHHCPTSESRSEVG